MNPSLSTHTLENLSQSVNDFVSEGGRALVSDDKRVSMKPNWKDAIAHLAPEVRARLMAKYSVTYNGRHYQTGGYRYGLLADAVAYAKLRRSLGRNDIGPTHPENVEVPTASQLKLMAELRITYEAGVYRFGAYRYDHLRDVVDYVQLKWHIPAEPGEHATEAQRGVC